MAEKKETPKKAVTAANRVRAAKSAATAARKTATAADTVNTQVEHTTETKSVTKKEKSLIQ